MTQRFLRAFLLCLSSLSFVLTAHAQVQSPWDCGDEKIRLLQEQLTPAYQEKNLQRNLLLRQYINIALQKGNNASNSSARGSGSPQDSIFTIPVVVHVVYPSGEPYGSGTNITYSQIRSQVEALNAAFSRSYPGYNNQSHPGYAQNTNIRFCLARIPSPSSMSWYNGPGGTEYGVKRYPDNSGTFDHAITVSSANQLLALTHPAADNFPFDKYLNIWLVKTIDGGNNIMGYSPRPLMGNYPVDGIVMRADVFGDNTTGGNYALGFNLTQGKIIAHEVGHYFDLYHIFQGGCSGANGAGAATDACDINGDFTCDIKPCTTQNVLCNNGTYNTCKANYDPGTTLNDMINDYMSYADDDCMNTFTRNQVQRMWAILKLQRSNLWQPANLAATGVLSTGGCIPPFLNASIVTDKSVFCAGAPVRFSNPTAGNTALTWQWRINGGIPVTSTMDTFTVTFNNPGNYTAVVTVSDGANIRTDSMILSVLTCRLDSSLLSMSHWYFGNFCSLDFTSGVPVQTTTALVHNTMQGESTYTAQPAYVEGTISLSDSSGNLLFYSNGVSIWNKNHQKITTAPIFGASDINATTGICYIPYPGKPGKYFIAGVYPNFDQTPSGVRFVMVDVVTGIVSPFSEFDHPSLPPRFSQFLTVVPHCNGTDYWIITKGFDVSDTRFYSFLVTANGIERGQAPVISTGFTHPGYGGSGNQLKSNPNGDKLILCSPHGYTDIESAVLYDFDSRTGEVKNEKVVPNISGYSNIQSGAAFSANGDYFYLMRSTNFATNGPPYWLFQYRVSDLHYNVIPTTGFYFAYPFQLGPDHQLYIVNGYNYLARLSNPDVWGGATFDDQFIYLKKPNEMIFAGSSLPAFIDAKRKEPTHPDFTIMANNCQEYVFNSICFDNYTATWNFGDGSPAERGNTVWHRYTKSGDYTVTLTISSIEKVFGSISKKVTAYVGAISITGPDSVCNTNNFPTQFFTRADSNVSYKWSVVNGTISGPDYLPYINVTWQNNLVSSGKLQLQLSAGNNCTLSTDKTVIIAARPLLSWLLKDSICVSAMPLVLKAAPRGGTFFGPGVSDSVFTPAVAGTGKHELTYRYGEGEVCASEVQKTITVSVPPVFTWQLQDSICVSALPLVLKAFPPGGVFTGAGVSNGVFNPSIAGIGTHTLTYKIGNENRCTGELSGTISVKTGCTPSIPTGPVMPNAFTPNADGLNDIFRIPDGLFKQLSQFSIYNRWGQKIFTTKNLSKGWGGILNGIPADAGTYVYFISGTKPGGEYGTLRGTVVLIR